MYDAYAARALANMEGQLPAGVLQEFVGLFANCQLPLSHAAPVSITASPENANRLYVDEIFQDGDVNNQNYSTLTVNNPFSVFVDGDSPYIDYGTSMNVYGVSWWQFAVINQQIVNRSRIKNLTIEKLVKEGYQFEDIEVVVNIEVDVSDPCHPSITPIFKTIKTLVQDKDAQGGEEPAEPAPDGPNGSQNAPSGPEFIITPYGPTDPMTTGYPGEFVPGDGEAADAIDDGQVPYRVNDPIIDPRDPFKDIIIPPPLQEEP
jgi:hypothetical protein